MESTSTEPSPPGRLGFNFVWAPKISMRSLSADEKIVLQVSPKFATVHDHVSFQWNLKIHGTAGRPNASDEELDERDANVSYVAVELYFVDGPVGQVDLRASVRVVEKEEKPDPILEERSTITMNRGRGAEITDKDRTDISDYIKSHVGRVVKISVLIKMDAKLFDPYTYLDKISPTPERSFLTANYNARVNSKIWKRRSRKKSLKEERTQVTRNPETDFEKKFAQIMDEEREKYSEGRLYVRRSVSNCGSRRSSTTTLLEHCHQDKDQEHLFKKILIACCESCERRRSSCLVDCKSDEESDHEGECSSGEEEDEEEERRFECAEIGKAHIHDRLANMYFNKVALPEMEYVEDFIDFLIDAELNDLPVLKRACERYLCGELNSKKDLVTWLVLDLLFLSIVFNLPVMKSMTLSELSMRTDELSQTDKLLEQEEYKKLDQQIRSLSDRNLVELIEQCTVFRDQRNRVHVIPLT